VNGVLDSIKTTANSTYSLPLTNTASVKF